jgi:hypothetical protein
MQRMDQLHYPTRGGRIQSLTQRLLLCTCAEATQNSVREESRFGANQTRPKVCGRREVLTLSLKDY